MRGTRFLVPAFLLSCSVAQAADLVAGPVTVIPARIVDGDTFVGDALIWPGHSLRIAVRIRGIDAPEIRSRCAAEAASAEQARVALAAILASGPITLTAIEGGKYYGRVIADVSAGPVAAVGEAMLSGGHARAYGGGRRAPWCGTGVP